MNRSKALLIVTIAVVFVLTSSCAARATSEGTSASVDVRKALDRFFDASKRQDWDAAGQTMSSDFQMYTDGAVSFGKSEYIRLLKEDNLLMGKYELRDLRVGVSKAQDLAWITYKGYFESTSHGKFSRMNTAETLLFRNENGEWRMFQAQASVQDLGSKAENAK